MHRSGLRDALEPLWRPWAGAGAAVHSTPAVRHRWAPCRGRRPVCGRHSGERFLDRHRGPRAVGGYRREAWGSASKFWSYPLEAGGDAGNRVCCRTFPERGPLPLLRARPCRPHHGWLFRRVRIGRGSDACGSHTLGTVSQGRNLEEQLLRRPLERRGPAPLGPAWPRLGAMSRGPARRDTSARRAVALIIALHASAPLRSAGAEPVGRPGALLAIQLAWAASARPASVSGDRGVGRSSLTGVRIRPGETCGEPRGYPASNQGRRECGSW
jgi:hypothetical protein